MNEYQESYEKEISLTELLFFCLKKWRWIVAAMLIAGILAGAYKYRSAVQSNQAKREAQAVAEEDGEEKETEIISNPNIEYYNLAIKNLQQEMEGLKNYIDTSVIMRMDPYHLETGNLSFYLDTGNSSETVRNSLVSAYEDFVTDGRLASEMLGADADISEAELQYLISFESEDRPVVEENYELSDGDSSAQIQISDIGRSKPNVFQIQITAENEEKCEAYMEAAQEAIMNYGAQLQEQIGNHEITLLAQSQTERIDSDIQTYQNTVLNNYSSVFTQLKTMQAELETVVKEEGETIVVGEAVVYENPSREAVKFAIIGLVLGAFLAAFVLVVIYLMSGKLQSTENFREEFGMPLLGQLTKTSEKRRIFGFLDRWIQRLEEGEYADITCEEQMKMAASNLKTAVAREEGVHRIMLAGTVGKDEAEKIRVRLMAELEDITFSPYERIVFQAAALEALDSCDGVVFLEKKGASSTKLIRKEAALAADRGVKILGAVVL